MDPLSPSQRRKCMQHNRATGTRIENIMAQALWQRGLRYRRNDRSLPGKPDFSFKGDKTVVFCDGDFWHGRNFTPDQFHTNQQFWIDKIQRNQARDQRNNQKLKDLGYDVLRFWGSDILKDVQGCVSQIEQHLSLQRRKKIRRNYFQDTDAQYQMAAEELISMQRLSRSADLKKE